MCNIQARRRLSRASASGELEVRHLWRGDRPDELELAQVVYTVEQTLTRAEKRWHEVDLHLVHESGREIPLGGLRSAGERHILTTSRLPRLFERRLDAIRDKRERCAAFKLDRLPGMMRENEHRVMVRG